MPERLFLEPGWMVAVAPGGVVLVGPEEEIDLDFHAQFESRLAVVDLLADGVDGAALATAAGVEGAEAAILVDHLVEEGALGPDAPAPLPASAASLAHAILSVGRGEALPGVCLTAEEALVVPEALRSSWTGRNLLRRFVAGLSPARRLAAYSRLASALDGGVRGDAPEPGRLDRVLDSHRGELDLDAVHLLDLREGRRESVPADGLDRVGAERPHRLGPVLETAEHRTGPGPGGTWVFLARYAAPSLRHSGDEGRWCRGSSPSRETAEIVARAEAVERYAAGEVSRLPLVRAKEDELEGAIDPGALVRLNDRQYRGDATLVPHDRDAPALWTPAWAPGGARRWLLAESVLYPFDDPEREHPVAVASSNGVAAHTDRSSAWRGALGELVERDAFMWHWVQRVSREHVDPRSYDPRLRAMAAAVSKDGRQLALVNLTLETHPVILAVVHREGLVSLGAACHHDPRAAAAKALEEAMTSLAIEAERPQPVEVPQPEEVLDPSDHLDLHRPAGARIEHEFLHLSSERVRLDDLPVATEPIEEAVRAVGEPLALDLSSALTRPFFVLRAVVPEMVPIAFGYDREPLGMPRLGEPKTTRDGRTLGQALDLSETGPLFPHPFA